MERSAPVGGEKSPPFFGIPGLKTPRVCFKCIKFHSFPVIGQQKKNVPQIAFRVKSGYNNRDGVRMIRIQEPFKYNL